MRTSDNFKTEHKDSRINEWLDQNPASFSQQDMHASSPAQIAAQTEILTTENVTGACQKLLGQEQKHSTT